jgi:anti-anti-sigma regulatory factor
MSVRISQLADQESGNTILRVEGALGKSEAELLEQTCNDLRKQASNNIVIDLKDITFVNNEGAAVIRRLKQQEGIILNRCQLFTHEIIEGPDAA